MIRDALNEFAAVSEREWLHDRSQTIGASEIGQCCRKVWFVKNGETPDDGYKDRWGAKVRGKVYESAWWEPALQARFGDKLLFAGKDQRTFTDGYLSATPDGLLVDDGQCVLLECKTADPRTRLDEAKSEHVFQVQVQLGLVRANTNYAPDRAVISYTDTSFWDEVKEFTVVFDPAVYDTARRRATAIMAAREAEELRPEGVIAGGRECTRCPFTRPCGQARARAVPEAALPVDGAAAAEIASMAIAAKAARKAAEANELRARELEAGIKEKMREAGTKRIVDGPISISWSAVKGRPAFDHKGLRQAAEAAGFDITPFQREGDPTDRLTITERERT